MAGGFHFNASGRPLVLRRAGEPGPGATPLTPAEAIRLIESAGQSSRARLIEVVERIEGRAGNASSWTVDALRTRVSSLLKSGRLVGWKPKPPAPPPPSERIEVTHQTGVLGPTSWIEIVLVDEENKPVANEAYVLDLGDGRVRKGTLDGNGKVREEELDVAKCSVSFPYLDPASWSAK